MSLSAAIAEPFHYDSHGVRYWLFDASAWGSTVGELGRDATARAALVYLDAAQATTLLYECG